MSTSPPKRIFPVLKAILGRVQTFHAVTDENRAIFGVDRILARDSTHTIICLSAKLPLLSIDLRLHRSHSRLRNAPVPLPTLPR
jgi:hypothetical protein